jgi:hypothetical protein
VTHLSGGKSKSHGQNYLNYSEQGYIKVGEMHIRLAVSTLRSVIYRMFFLCER